MLHARPERVVVCNEPLLIEQHLRRQRDSIFKDRHLKPSEVDLDPSLQLRKRPAEEVFVNGERYLAAREVELDQICLMRIAIENCPAFDEYPQARRELIE